MDEDTRPVGECDFMEEDTDSRKERAALLQEKIYGKESNEEELPTHRTGGST